MQLQLHRSGVVRASFVPRFVRRCGAIVLLLWLVLIIVIVVVEPNCDTAILRPPLLAAGGPPVPAGVTSYTENSLPPRRGRGFVVKKEENTEIKEKKTVSAPPLTPEQRRNGNTPRWTPTLRHNNGRGREGARDNVS